jgi:biopolymer transport protein ExbD
MIQMPRRSVTRFFIPLIDVLLLLFCIFLLMPKFAAEDLEKKAESAVDLAETVAALERELQLRNQELATYEDLRPMLAELEKMREELERLKRERKLIVQRTNHQLIDVDGKTGEIYYYDAAKPKDPKLKIESEEAAHALIDRHRREAKDQEVYYYFVYPRPESGYPTLAQERRYKAWFANVAHSLKEMP